MSKPSDAGSVGLYGDENQMAMIKRKVPMWLLPLVFYTYDNVKYYAYIAIAAFVANKKTGSAILNYSQLFRIC